MTDWPMRVVRLAASPFEPGLWCGPDGLSLSGEPLLEKDQKGFAPRRLSDLQGALDAAYGQDAGLEAENYFPGLTNVARSLNRGDLPLAMIGSLMLKLPEVDDWQKRDAGLKQAFDLAQPRDENGRWTQGAGSEAKGPPPPGIAPIEAPALEGAGIASVAQTAITELAPRVVGLLAQLARLLPGPLALGAGVLIPTNESNVHSGDLPGSPGLTYTSDEGIVTISQLTANGKIENLYHGFPDADGFYHDDQGEIVGREVGTGVLFDNEYLAELAAPKPDTSQDAKPASSPTTASLPNSDQDEPRVCPPAVPENIAGRSRRSLAYQSQITGLPPGFDVALQSVRFDGCDESTGRMIEAKGLGMDWMLNWPYDKLVQSRFYKRMMRQAERQNEASAGRGDDYYFADKRMADFFAGEFDRAGYSNIRVHQIDAIVKKLEEIISWIRRHCKIPTFNHTTFSEQM